jgi:hypothetical protein
VNSPNCLSRFKTKCDGHAGPVSTFLNALIAKPVDTAPIRLLPSATPVDLRQLRELRSFSASSGSGFQGVGALTKDDGGVWRGAATKDGQSVQVWLDYKGNAGQQGGVAQTRSAPGATNLDGTTGNQPGTAAGRAVDRTLGTNTTGANPVANAPDGTAGNPPGTATGRAIDKTLGTNTTGANPAGTSAAAPR